MGTASDVEKGKQSAPSSGCWSYRTGLEKALFKTLFVITAIAVVLAVITAHNYMHPVESSAAECTTVSSKHTEPHVATTEKSGEETTKKEGEETTKKEEEKTTKKEEEETTKKEDEETTKKEGEETTKKEEEKTTKKEEEETTKKEDEETTKKEDEETTKKEGEETTKKEDEETTKKEEEETTKKEEEETTKKEDEETTKKEDEETTKKEEGGEEICESKECEKQAEEIMEAMDDEVDPCENFYEYACGKWIEHNPIPADKSDFNSFSKLHNEIKEKLKELLEEEVTMSNEEEEKEPEAVKKAKILFKSCMDTEKIEELKSEPLEKILKELGGWPVVDEEWEEKEFNLNELLIKINLLDHSALWENYVSADSKDSNENAIQISQGSLGLGSRDYYLEERYEHIIKAYTEFAVGIAEKLGAKEPKEEIEEMVKFEKELAKIMAPRSELRKSLLMYHKYKLEELDEKMTEHIDFDEYIVGLFKEKEIEIEKDEEIIVHGKEYFEELGKLVKETEKKTLANFIVWKFVKSAVYYLSEEEFGKIIKEYSEARHGTSKEPERWNVCVSSATHRFKYAVGRLFVEKHFDVESKNEAKEMIEELTKSFKEILEDTEWMDKETREKAVEKVEKMETLIGYPDYILNNKELDEHYEDYKVEEKEYFENVANIWEIDMEENMKLVGKPVDRKKWGMGPATVNAYHSSTKNLIAFPGGILQSPFYNKDSPKSLNFGGIGVVIGHEITHGFDDHGRLYDAEGNMKKWWPEEVIEKFSKKAECIVEQYNKYYYKEIDLHVNGKNTQGENIADNGGLKESFKAYRALIKKEGKEEKTLPKLGLTSNQLFFIGYAQVWCGDYRKEKLIQRLKTDPHSPGRYRVIGALSNSEDFAEAYKCKEGSKMNPEKKCSVW